MTDVHHIAGRGGPDPHRLDNLIGLCRECHDKAHSMPEWARKFGLMRTRHRLDTD
jgi:5-methylcytosine-specific restriction endonuclease McrA